MKNRILILVSLLCVSIIIICCTIKIVEVNKRYPDTVVINVPYGEKTEYKNFELQIQDTKYIDYDELKSLNGNVSELYDKYEKYYNQTFALIELQIKSCSDKAGNVELYQTVLGNNTSSNGVDVDLFEKFNDSSELLCPKLQPDESVRVVLTYSFLNQYFKNEKIDNMGLIVSLYPQKIFLEREMY